VVRRGCTPYSVKLTAEGAELTRQKHQISKARGGALGPQQNTWRRLPHESGTAETKVHRNATSRGRTLKGAHLHPPSSILLPFTHHSSLISHYDILSQLSSPQYRINQIHCSQFKKPIEDAATWAIMLSEQRYDFSYAQFVQGDLPTFELFGDSTIPPTTGTPFYNFQENYMANPLQGGHSFSEVAETPEQSQQFGTMGAATGDWDCTTFATPWPSALDEFASTETFEGTGHLDLAAANLLSWDSELQTFDISIDHSQMSPSEAAQSSLWSINSVHPNDLATTSNNVTQRAHLDTQQFGPIGVSFFFRLS
jgi:hypothetical protein